MVNIFRFGWRVWILIIVLLLAVIAINPSPFNSGVVIKHIDSNSTEKTSGLSQGEIIKSINGKGIRNLDDYSKVLEQFSEGESKKYTHSYWKVVPRGQ